MADRLQSQASSSTSKAAEADSGVQASCRWGILDSAPCLLFFDAKERFYGSLSTLLPNPGAQPEQVEEAEEAPSALCDVCKKPTWDGKPGYCSEACKQAAKGKAQASTLDDFLGETESLTLDDYKKHVKGALSPVAKDPTPVLSPERPSLTRVAAPAGAELALSEGGKLSLYGSAGPSGKDQPGVPRLSIVTAAGRVLAKLIPSDGPFSLLTFTAGVEDERTAALLLCAIFALDMLEVERSAG